MPGGSRAGMKDACATSIDATDLSVPATVNLPSVELDVVGSAASSICAAIFLRLGDDLVGGDGARRCRRARRARAEGAGADRRPVGVAVLNADVDRDRCRACRQTICLNVVSWPWPCEIVPGSRSACRRDRIASRPSRRRPATVCSIDVGEADAAQLAARLAPPRGAARSRRSRPCAAPCRDSCSNSPLSSVIDEAGLERHRARPARVAAAQLGAVDAELARRDIDQRSII